MSRGHRLYIKLGAVHCIGRGVTVYTLSLVWFTVYVKGPQAIISKSNCISISEDLFLSSHSIVRHYLWVVSVCQSMHLGVTSIQIVKAL